MAIKELFNDARPQVLFDPRASQRIDPRFKFTRNGPASYYDRDGVLRVMAAPANQPRVGFNYEPDENGVMLPVQGLLIEKKSTNLALYSEELKTNWAEARLTILSSGDVGYVSTIAPDGSNPTYWVPTTVTNRHQNVFSANAPETSDYTASFFVKADPSGYYRFGLLFGGTSSVFNANTGLVETGQFNVQPLTNGWYRISHTISSAIGTSIGVVAYILPNDDSSNAPGDGTKGMWVWGAQLEAGSLPTSYIPTTSSTVTREPDLLTIEAPLPSTGSIYIDARAITTDVNATLLSAAPASPSTDKLALVIREPADLYNSKALVYEVNGAFKPTLPFPVPTDARERNLITYGANNYHYRSDSARLTPSSSSNVPANMTRLGIGHDVTDSTNAFTGYINAVYLWSGEITPTVAEALVRGDVDPKDADAGVFEPEAGSLAFVFNTQGTAADGDTVVQLPLRGSTNNVRVDWGDNTDGRLIGAAASVTVNHTYTSAGIYPVQITADDDGTNSGLENLQFFGNSPLDLVRVLQWSGSTTFNPTTMYRIFRDCTQLDFDDDARINLPDTSGCSDWREAFYNCSSLSGQYPNFDHSGASGSLQNTWSGCSSITTFSSSLDDLNTAGNYVTNYFSTWAGCSSITSFPTITIPNDQGDVSLSSAWNGCSSLESFPSAIDTSAVTNFSQAWNGCSSLKSFPQIDTSSGTNFGSAWQGCSSLDNKANAAGSESFPQINTSSGTNFARAWRKCSSLTSFPSIDTRLGTTFNYAWEGCSSLTDFPANFFNSWDPASVDDECFYLTWANCDALTPASVVNILNSIAASGKSAPSGTDTHDKKITIDWDGTGDPATDASAAITTLKSRNWQIYLNGVLQ